MRHLFLTTVTMALTCCSAYGASAVIERIGAADLIIIGETTSSGAVANGALSFNVSVKRALKGSAAGSALDVQFVGGPAARQTAGTASGVCGLFFLRQEQGRWFVIPRSDPQSPVVDLLYPSDACGAGSPPTGPATTDDIVALVLHSLYVGTPDDGYVLLIFNSVYLTDSPAVASAASQLSGSARANLRILGLAWRIALGDDSALSEVPDTIPVLKRGLLEGVLVSPIAAYAHASAAAVQSLGAIAAHGAGTPFEYAASMALRALHTTDALPYLQQLLDSANRQVRLNAVAGLSMALLDVPPLVGDPQAVFEKALNPAVRKKLSAADEAHIYFAGPDYAARESELVVWWKGRAPQMVAAAAGR